MKQLSYQKPLSSLSWRDEQALKYKLAREIASAFPEARIVESKGDDGAPPFIQHLDLGNEATLYIGFDFRKERVLISGGWVRCKGDGSVVCVSDLRHNAESAGTYQEITISLKKPLETIKRDIEHRFLPGYLLALGECKKIRDSRDAYRREQDNAVSNIASLCGGRVAQHSNEKNHIYSKLGAFTVYGNSVKVELRVTVNQAARLAEFLNELVAEDESLARLAEGGRK